MLQSFDVFRPSSSDMEGGFSNPRFIADKNVRTPKGEERVGGASGQFVARKARSKIRVLLLGEIYAICENSRG
jgi:hypothetical protein